MATSVFRSIRKLWYMDHDPNVTINIERVIGVYESEISSILEHLQHVRDEYIMKINKLIIGYYGTDYRLWKF